jgi:hypothetical protein
MKKVNKDYQWKKNKQKLAVKQRISGVTSNLMPQGKHRIIGPSRKNTDFFEQTSSGITSKLTLSMLRPEGSASASFYFILPIVAFRAIFSKFIISI